MAVGDKVTFLHRKRAVPLDQKNQGQKYRHGLRTDGRDGCAGRPHAEGTDEKVVESDVDKACDRHEDHRAFGIAKSPENAADHVVGRDEGNADEADHKVIFGLLEGLRRHCQNTQDPVREDQKYHGQYGGKARKERRGIADKAGRLALRTRADGPADAHRGAHGQADDHNRQHVHDLTADCHGRHRRGAIKLPCDEQIRHAIEGLQKAGDQIGDRKLHHLSE